MGEEAIAQANTFDVALNLALNDVYKQYPEFSSFFGSNTLDFPPSLFEEPQATQFLESIMDIYMAFFPNMLHHFIQEWEKQLDLYPALITEIDEELRQIVMNVQKIKKKYLKNQFKS